MKLLLKLIFLASVLNYTTYAKADKTSLNWPIITDRSVQISSTFGESRLDHFHTGVDLPGEGLRIKPISAGRLIWKTQGRKRKRELPFGGGATIIVDHGKYSSGYMHLKSTLTEINQAQSTMAIKADQALGISGNTGHSGGAHLHFFVYENQKRRFINPLGLLSKQHYSNHKNADVLFMSVKIKDELIRVNINRPIVLSQDFNFYAAIYDRGKALERWGVYSLAVYNHHSTQPSHQVTFDYIQQKNNRWLTSNDQNFEDIFMHTSYNLGNGFKRTGRMKLVLSGLDGPISTYNFNLNIKDK